MKTTTETTEPAEVIEGTEKVYDIDAEIAKYNQSANIPDIPDAETSEPVEPDAPEPEQAGNDPDAPYGRFANGKPRKRPAKSRPETKNIVIDSTIISGALFLLLWDFLFPQVIAAIANRYDSVNKVSATDLKLTREQRKDLEPVADAVMNYMKLSVHPLVTFFLATTGAYAMNLVRLKTFGKDGADGE